MAEKPTYLIYKHGEYVGEGTMEELAELTGRSASTLHSNYSIGSRIWEIIRTDTPLKKRDVDNQRILNLMDEFGYTRKELAETIGLKYPTLSQKLRETNPWKREEIEELEDLFFLEEGDLLID